jgi:hypothetical protein
MDDAHMSPNLSDVIDQSPAAVIHTALGSGILAAAMGWLPQAMAVVAGLIGAAYYTISIWESRTVQQWVTRRRMRRKAKTIARLRAKEKVIMAQIEALKLLRLARHEAAVRLEAAEYEAKKMITTESTAENIKNVPPRDDRDLNRTETKNPEDKV